MIQVGFGCGTPFNVVTNRHHHCRACGRVVCGDCSRKRSKRVKGYSKAQRVCDECEERIREGGFFEALRRAAFAVCPCLKILKREVRKHQSQQVLFEGAVFLRYTGGQKALNIAKQHATQLFGRVSKFLATATDSAPPGGDAASAEAGESLGGHGRIRVKLRPDCATLSLCAVANEDEEEVIYLHDVAKVQGEAPHSLLLLGREDVVLFRGAATDVKTRDRWVVALRDVVADAQTKPPPLRDRSRGSMLANTARRATREIELQTRKRDAEKRKQDLLKGTGLRYTALAMSERGNSSSSSSLA